MRNHKNATTGVLVVLTALTLYASYTLLRPFLGPILFAIVMAIAFHPLHAQFQKLFSGRNTAALGTTLTAMLITAVPLFLLGLAVSAELADLFRSASAKTASEGGLVAYILHGIERVLGWAGKYFPVATVDLRDLALRRLGEMGSGLVQVGAGLAGNIFSLVTDAVIASVILFFVFRDGEAGLARVSALLPLPPGSMARLKHRVSATVVANLYGGVAVGAAQGLLTGLAFWVLGIGSPVLWGLATGVLSLIPFVGSAIVWLPAAIIEILGGHPTKGIILLAWGAGVVGLVDNIIRPWIVSERAQLHPLYVFFAVLGGVEVFGIAGLFAGPVIVSLAAALLGILEEDIKMRTSTKEVEVSSGGSS